MTDENDKPESVLEEAMDWLLRLNSSSSAAGLAAEFELWLRQSEEHRKAWDRARKTWQIMGEVPPAYEHVWQTAPGSQERAEKAPQLATRMSNASRPARRWVQGVAAAAVVVLCLVGAWNYPAIRLRMEADYVTEVAESRTIKLSDGTTIELAAESAIKADVSGATRRVTLLRGEAYFDVYHDSSRPFVVDAGGIDVRVLGTAFNVQLSSASTSVELARGAVGISLEQAGPSDAMKLAPGEMVIVDRKSGKMLKSAIALEDIASWRDGRLFVNDATIGSVVEQLQRYNPAWIAIPDSSLATQRVTGLYDLRNPDRALRALVEPYGGNVREVSRFARVISRF
ncbi:FecR family protein [Rhizobium sp. SYY.PMSO]|uniref:FecR family protein n=1 Tax=Rhizobium sp. SYY.PMSO TaxID=3382192 RepID=UPI0039901414